MTSFSFSSPTSNPFNISIGSIRTPNPTFTDIDGDGDLDLFIGDNINRDVYYFENTGTSNNPIFAAATTNPFGLTRPRQRHLYPTFADIDNDGDKDLFVGGDFGIDFYENTGTSAAPAFTAPLQNPFSIGTSNTPINVPSFVDIDADGDLDLFMGSIFGPLAFYENTGSASSPLFGSANVSPFGLNTPADFIDLPIANFADGDGDGDLDLFLGDNINPQGNLYYYENTGTTSAPSFGSKQTNPFGYTPTFRDFSTPSFADINGDGDLDLFVGQKRPFSEILFYENTAPTLSSSTPADDATAVAIGANLVLNFSETVVAGTGDFIIKKADGTTVATIPVSGAQVSISGSTVTIDPSTDLDYATSYYVEIASGVLKDSANNNYAGISGSTTLNFTTAAAPVSVPERERDPAPAPATPSVVDSTPADPAPAGTNIQSTDDDGDGLREVVTASDGTTVDGNRDGIPDAEQTEVAGLRLINGGAMGSDYGAISIGNGLQLAAVTLISANSDSTLAVTTRGGGTLAVTTPTGISNAFAGVVSFEVSGVDPGGSTTATISFPTGLAANGDLAYLRFNYETNRFEDYVDAQGNPLYSFEDSNGDSSPDAVVLQLVDGDPQWDGDGIANGTVVDPGFLGTGQRNLNGTKRRDSLIGNVLGNEIRGKAGKDRLYGDLGADFITGGKDTDRIIYYSADESTASQADTVKFGKKDRFQFRSFDGDSLTEGQQSLRYIGKKAFSGAASELRFTGSGLQADTTGDGQADFVVNFAKATPWFSEANILL